MARFLGDPGCQKMKTMTQPGLRMASGGTESDTGAIARSPQEFVDQLLRKEIR